MNRRHFLIATLMICGPLVSQGWALSLTYVTGDLRAEVAAKAVNPCNTKYVTDNDIEPHSVGAAAEAHVLGARSSASAGGVMISPGPTVGYGLQTAAAGSICMSHRLAKSQAGIAAVAQQFTINPSPGHDTGELAYLKLALRYEYYLEFAHADLVGEILGIKLLIDGTTLYQYNQQDYLAGDDTKHQLLEDAQWLPVYTGQTLTVHVMMGSGGKVSSNCHYDAWTDLRMKLGLKNAPPSVTPEPMSAMMSLSAAAGLLLRYRRKRITSLQVAA